jgi:hypothetical protein
MHVRHEGLHMGVLHAMIRPLHEVGPLIVFRLPAGAAGRDAAVVPQPLLPQPRGG